MAAATCPPGWTANRIFFRETSGCSAPQGLFEAAFAVTLFLSLLTLALGAHRMRRVRGELRVLVLLFCLSSLSLCIASALALAQDANKTGFWVGMAIFVMFISTAYARMLRMFFVIWFQSLGLANSRTLLRVRVLLYLTGVSLILPLGIILPGYVLSLGDFDSPGFPVDTYNLAVLVMFGSFPAHLVFALPMGLLVTRVLVTQLSKAADHPATQAAQRAALADLGRRIGLFRSFSSPSSSPWRTASLPC
jgi:hypothetical protein